MHLAVDANSELPIWFNVTAANTYDGHSLAPVLTDAHQRFEWFKPEFVCADKGYDSEKVFRFVGEGLGATSVIDVQKSHLPKPSAVRTKSDYRPCEASGVEDMLGNVRFQCDPTRARVRCSRRAAGTHGSCEPSRSLTMFTTPSVKAPSTTVPLKGSRSTTSGCRWNGCSAGSRAIGNSTPFGRAASLKCGST